MRLATEQSILTYSPDEKQLILSAACLIVCNAVKKNQVKPELPTDLLKRETFGVFVSLKRGKVLRGCCGVHGRSLFLEEALPRAAVAATSDRRMKPIEEEELPFLTLGVSILDAPEPLNISSAKDLDQIVIGTHGLRLQLGKFSGLLLPSVARERRWNALEFLDALCHKAQVPADSWRHPQASLMLFTGIDFNARIKFAQPLVIDDGVRQPAVSGRFYPREDAARDEMLQGFENRLAPVEKKSALAALVPHAGLRYSGLVAADVWRRIKLPSSIVVLSPKHPRFGANWAVSPHRDWQLSESVSVPGHVDMARAISEQVPCMLLDSQAHQQEHGIEVQLPFVYRYEPTSRVVGIAMGPSSPEEVNAAAIAFAKCISGFSELPLLVISSDMNHYENLEETHRKDALAMAQLQLTQPEGLLEICESESISMCGRLPAAFVMLVLRHLEIPVSFEKVSYSTSADVSGNKKRVVGYAGGLFTQRRQRRQ